MIVDPAVGFTSDVIKDPNRFVGRTELIRSCIKAINAPTGLIAVYGKRGVGKSSLLRQIQQMALGDYTLAQNAGLYHEVPETPRTYLTVFYSCDSYIENGESLLKRLCNDRNPDDSFLRLVPDEGKELTEFRRYEEMEGGTDLKILKWGAKGGTVKTYSDPVQDDVVQTFRNHVSSIVHEQVLRRERDGLLILLDEVDVIRSKSGLGSLIKSLSGTRVKFGICGIGSDLTSLVRDHQSVDRLLEQGSAHVRPMPNPESVEIISKAEELFDYEITFNSEVKEEIADISDGYPYFTQLIGKSCVEKAVQSGLSEVGDEIYQRVLDDIATGRAFPTLEAAYKRAIGQSEDRQLLLHLLAEQVSEEGLFAEGGNSRVYLRIARKDAADFSVKNVDQVVPRLIDPNYGPALFKERPGVYEFASPVFRVYVKLRSMKRK